MDVWKNHKDCLITLDLVFTSNDHRPVRRVISCSCEGKARRGRVESQRFFETGLDIDELANMVSFDGVRPEDGVDFSSYFGVAVRILQDECEEKA